MCDTLVALGNSTKDGSVIFAKNSDRDPNEAHQLLIIPAADHSFGENVKCTYIDIPQVKHTNSVLLAKPFWIWGAEMGANEHGVVIGNEAVFSKVPYGKKTGLIGMDFLRLALERSETAREAMEQIIGLLEEYGQGGNCGYSHPLYYHNSFILADFQDAWVLETAGKFWIAEQVKTVRSISNGYSIHKEWDLACSDLVDYALEQGWCKTKEDFDFGLAYSDFLYSTFSDGRRRHQISTACLEAEAGGITVESMMNLLRQHGSTDESWQPDKAVMGQDICAHAGFGPIRISQSVGSMVSHLSKGNAAHWLTATSAPCTSIFKPVWLEAGLPDGVGLGDPKGVYDETSLWWRHEHLHREVLRNYQARIQCITESRDILEKQFLTESCQSSSWDLGQKLVYSEACFSEAERHRIEWLRRVKATPLTKRNAFYYNLAWNKLNREAKMTAHLYNGI